MLPGFAQGAVAGVEAGVIRQTGGVKDGGDRVAQALVGGGKNSRKPCHDAAVVVHGFHGCLNGVAGGDGCRKDEHVLALDHGGKIIPQNDLAAGSVLRRDDIDGLVGVHIGKAVLGQLVGKAGANDLCAVQTEHGIHDGAVLVSADQLLCHGLCLGKAGLLGGHVDVIVDVAVAGGKMSLGHPQEQFAFAGGKLDHVDHCTALLFSPGAAAPQNTKQRGSVPAAALIFLLCFFIVLKNAAVHKTQT